MCEVTKMRTKEIRLATKDAKGRIKNIEIYTEDEFLCLMKAIIKEQRPGFFAWLLGNYKDKLAETTGQALTEEFDKRLALNLNR
jgi:hypothetical protein